MNKSIIQRCLYSVCCGLFCLLSSFCVYAQEGTPPEDPKDKIEDTSLYKAINAVGGQNSQISAQIGPHGVVDMIKNVTISFVYPIVLVIALLSAILGVRKFMVQEDEGSVKIGRAYIIYGTIGIVIITVAWFMTVQLVGNQKEGSPNAGGLLNNGNGFANLSTLANGLAENIIPFVTMASSLAAGALFCVLLWQVIKFLISGSEDVTQKAQRIMIRNTIGILVILSANTLVKLVYNLDPSSKNAAIEEIRLGGETISPVFKIINIALGLLFLIMIIMIIVMAYQLLVKPNDSGTMQQLSRSLIYIFAGLLLIGFAYVIVNFLIVGRV